MSINFDLSTLSKANVSRDYSIFEEFAMQMVNYARRIRANNEFEVKAEGNIYTILQVIGFSLHDKTPIKQLFTTNGYKNTKELNCNSLVFN